MKRILQSLFHFVRVATLCLPNWVNAAEIAVTQDNGMNRPLGNGYDLSKQMLRGQCVEGKSSLEVPNEGTVSQGNLKLHIEADQSSTADKLGFALGGRARIGLITYHASAEYYTESLSSGLSLSYQYTGEFMYNAYLVNSTASPVNLRPDMEGYLSDAFSWYGNCGDEYVFAWDKGARLFLSLRMDFVSRDEKSRFGAQFGAEGPLFNVDGSFSTSSANYSKNTQLTINALQVGGDPAKLGSIFCPPNGTDGSPNPNCLGAARKAISCSFGDLGPCIDVMSQMVAYGNGQDDQSFGGQIKNFQRYNTLKLYTQPWRYLGHRFPLPPTPQDVANYETNLQILNDLFEENYQNWATAYRYWKGKAPRLSEGAGHQRDQMGALWAQFKTNMSVVAEGIRSCYDSPMSCDGNVRNVKSRIHYGLTEYPTAKSIDALTVPETYAQFCDLQTTDPALKKTILALDQAAFKASGVTRPEDWARGDVCFRAQDILSRLESLDLSSQGITDLRPISTLSKLRRIDLSKNSIRDLSRLTGLPELEELKLDDNLIIDLRPLGQLTSLRILSLQNNRLTDATILNTLPNLVLLDLRRNRPAVNCPLHDPSACRTVDFSALSSFSELNRIGGYYDGRVGSVAGSLPNGDVLITGGLRANGDAQPWVEILNSQTLVFEQATSLRYPHVQHTVTPISQCQLLVAGGGDFGNRFEVYDACVNHGGLRGATVAEGVLSAPRTGHSATVLSDGRVLLIGGWTQGVIEQDHRLDATATAEIYDPRTGLSLPTGSMHLPRVYHAAARLADGRVLISGGYLTNQGIDTLEIYDPTTERFTMLRASLTVGRSNHSMTPLSDGTFLIAGGYSTDNLAVASSEIYDPRLDISREGPKLATARGAHAAVSLGNGKILFAGGSSLYSGGVSNQFNHNGRSLVDAEIYDSLTSTFSPLNPMKKARSYPIAIPIPGSRILIMGGMGSEAGAKSAEIFEYSRIN